MKNKLSRFKEPFTLVLGALGYALLLKTLNISCPILKLTGISCPGCGMTRALISALQFNFAKAFYFHPLWLIFIIFSVLLIILYIYEKKKMFKLFLGFTIVLFIFTYILRLFLYENDIVNINIEQGLIYQFFHTIFK